MNFTLEKKFNLALICLGLQLLMWIIGYLFPLFPYVGEVYLIFYRILNVFSVLGMLPFFISVVKNRNLLFNPQFAETTKKTSQPSSSILIKHIATRVGSIIILFVLAYVFILDGRGDSMGYGLLYAGLATICITFVGLAIDAILIYKNEKDSSRFYTNIFIISALVLGGFSVFGGV